MEAQNKDCANCSNQFTIEPEDFEFYEKLQVPPPTFCSDCRLIRRMSFRNEFAFNKRACDLCQNSIISIYPEGTSFPVYCHDCWYSDKWDARDFGQDYDFEKNFFQQFKELMNKTPRPALIGSNNVDTPYMNYTADVKSSYYAICSAESENCGYTYRTFFSKECYDCFGAAHCEQCYETTQCTKCTKTALSKNSEGMIESVCVSDCKNSSYCLGCVNLRNKQYQYLNNEISQDEFKKRRMKLGSFAKLEQLKKDARGLELKHPKKFAKQIMSENCTGNELSESKNCKNCFFVRGGENLKYGYFCSNFKDSRDFNFGDNSEMVYESANIEKNYNERFSLTSWFSKDISYCELCFSSSNLFGCIGLRNSKEYCILNKQYSKEEYEQLVEKIISQMKDMPYTDANGLEYRYGEFFPAELSPFAYNETVAQEYFPLNKETATQKGLRWKDFSAKDYQISLDTPDIPDDIDDVSDSILNEIISCAHKGQCEERCSTAFKLTPQELQFYKNQNLPLPRLCPNCRHFQRLNQRNPLKLWHRGCMEEGCSNEFETSYAPERPEIVYCEQCYQQEVN